MRLIDVKALAIDCYPGLVSVLRDCASIREVQTAIRAYKLGADGNHATATTAPNAVQPSHHYGVHLVGFGDNKIGFIKLVREILAMPLKESKDLVEAASLENPQLLADHLSKVEADALGARVDAAGGYWILTT